MTDAEVSFWVMLGTITEGGTCAIGGKRTVTNQPAEREGVTIGSKRISESYVAGGGDFVRAVTKLSLGVVLSELTSGGTEEGYHNQGEMWEGGVLGKSMSHEDGTAAASDLPELEIVRWVSYNHDDAKQLLQTGKPKRDYPNTSDLL
jgi:hypothetical protein